MITTLIQVYVNEKMLLGVSLVYIVKWTCLPKWESTDVNVQGCFSERKE